MFGLSVDAIGKSGGLALLWHKQVHVDLLSFSKGHIDARVKLTDEESYWRFTGFYGAPDASQRSISWNLLRHLSTISNLPWLCTGDFNAILSDTEKESANPTPPRHLHDFRNALIDSRLFDVGFSGHPFTWCNNRESPYTVRKRLDRACTNSAWNNCGPIHMFPIFGEFIQTMPRYYLS
ncbi:UNVERIFIED_CONTAM: hypothetical protein Sradi_1766000 [Sesamum radiatum]|uniref:Endonuclease/exonuclease/phosphatase domain-containing protein n=1 Tax=Sesamum radiatum TaxID=300843 RepID=A0AAW2TXT0_SESRA